MQSFTKTLLASSVACVAVLGSVASTSRQVTVPAPRVSVLKSQMGSPAALAAPAMRASVLQQPTVTAAKVAKAAIAAVIAPKRPRPAAEEAVRARLKFDTVRWRGQVIQTLDEPSRILLAQAAADKAGLRDVGLSYHDVYGVIEAETSWIPRTGSSKNGTPNLGLAQFEPATARGLGLDDPEDPVQAVFAAALHIKQAAQWSTRKIDHLDLEPEQRAAKLREGVSVFYNLSVKGRNRWDGLNTADLPTETQRHIRNAAAGAMEAVQLARQLKA